MTTDSHTIESGEARAVARTHHPRLRVAHGAIAGALLFATSLLACAGGDGLTGPSSFASAGAQTPRTEMVGMTTTNTPYEGLSENKCNGEMVPVRGKVAYTFFVSGLDVTHQKVKFSWVMDGEGSLGNVYHGSEEYEEELNVSILPMETTMVHEVHMVSNTGPDYFEQFVFHLTISGSGETTATVERGPTVDCRAART
jgi:hypothetical protein